MSNAPEYRTANPLPRELFSFNSMPSAAALQRLYDAIAFISGRGCQISFDSSGGLVIDIPPAWCGFVFYGVDRYYDATKIPVTGDRRGTVIIDTTDGTEARCLVFSRQAPHVTWRPKSAEQVPQPLDEEWYDEANLPSQLHCPAFGNG